MTKFAGQRPCDVHTMDAGGPGGHIEVETRTPRAARQKRAKKLDGHVPAGNLQSAAVEAPGQVHFDAHTSTAGGDPIAGQSKSEDQTGSAGNGADLGHLDSDVHDPPAEIRATIDQLIEIGRQNSFAIRQRMRVRQAMLSHIARVHFGYHTALTEAERKKAMDAASALIKAIGKGEEHPAASLALATDAAAAPWEDVERDTEKAMVKLAKKLPAYEWVKGVRGFGDLSFARIVAETGDLSSYANPGKVWKRLGLAVFDGKSQRKSRDAEKAVEQGYSPRRRSVSWVAFHAVWISQAAKKESGGQDTVEAQMIGAAGAEGAGQGHDDFQIGCAGPYRSLYDAKKSEYLARVEAGEDGWTKLRADRCAKRYAEKRWLRDLWSAWHRDIAGQVSFGTQGSTAGDGDRGGHAAFGSQSHSAAPVTPRKKKR